MKKSVIIPIILTVLVWFVMFYVYLPAINIQSKPFWNFVVVSIVIGIVINMWAIIKGVFLSGGGFKENREGLKKFKFVFIIIGLFVVFYVGGDILSSPILRASAYRDLITVSNSDFTNDIKEVNFSKIPILDKDSAAKLSERKMGSMVDMVSQYEVSGYFNQINYQGKPVRVTPLEYASSIKWLTNRNTGIPAYIKIDMTTQDVELVKLSEGIKYSPSEYFGRDLYRYLRFKYPTYMFRSFNFEIDDNGNTFWVCPVEEKSIGLFGGTDIKGAVLLNAVTGEHQYFDISQIPQWIDKVYDAELIIDQYDYHGLLVNGYINSIFGQKGCLQTTEGYNYIALNDDVWVYTGVTSILGDESNVGFVLVNQRTKETKYYQISGAKEVSAMSSAEGQVQHLGYTATFPLLLNVSGEPTYFLALKDGAGLVKKYAMVNIEKYQIVAIGDSVSECEKNYKSLMQSNGIETVNSSDILKTQGKISAIKEVVIDGNTVFYISLENSNELFEVVVKNNLSVLKKNIGDSISIEYTKTLVDGINSTVSLDNIKIIEDIENTMSNDETAQ